MNIEKEIENILKIFDVNIKTNEKRDGYILNLSNALDALAKRAEASDTLLDELNDWSAEVSSRLDGLEHDVKQLRARLEDD